MRPSGPDSVNALSGSVEIQWLSDNGGPYTSTDTVLYAQTLGFRPVTTPAYSPESTAWPRLRDTVSVTTSGADLSDGETVIRQLPDGSTTTTESLPLFLGMRSPRSFVPSTLGLHVSRSGGQAGGLGRLADQVRRPAALGEPERAPKPAGRDEHLANRRADEVPEGGFVPNAVGVSSLAMTPALSEVE